MKIKRAKLLISRALFIFLFLISPFFVQNLLACSCNPRPSIYDSFNNSQAVFTGKIISTEDVKINYSVERRYRVKLLENFKGDASKEITISAGDIGSSCFWGAYDVGESYLIYSYGRDDEVFSAGRACSRIARLEDAADQIFFIRELLKGKPESQVYGRVVIQENDLQTNELKERSLAGFEVTVKSKLKTFKTTTDKDGFYRFNNLPFGTYELKTNVPAKYGLYFSDKENFIVLKNKKICRSKYSMISPVDEKGCFYAPNVSDGVYLTFTLRWNNEINIKVVDSEGQSVEKARVRMLPVGKSNDEFNYDWRDTYLRDRDDYVVFGKTPGKYILAVEMDSPLKSTNKIRFFYPQTTSAEKAQIFDITETSYLNLDFKLPEEIKIRNLIGEVIRENGGSVGGFISVSLDSSENAQLKENKQFGAMPINAQGLFEFKTLENEEYWLHVWINVWEEVDGAPKEVKKLIKTEKVKIGKEESVRKIMIVLPEN